MSRSIARKAGAILLLAALVAAMHLAPGLDTFVVQTGMRNSLHTIGFFAVAFVLFELLPGPLVVRGILTVLVAVGIGFLAETTQAYTGSSFDIEDAGRDAAGALLYVLARLTWSWSAASGSGAVRLLARTLAAAFGIAAAVPLAYWSSIFLAERWKAPVVADFEGRWSDYFFYGINAEVRLVAAGGDHHLQASLVRRPRSGFAVTTALYDWTAYETLVFDARLEGAESTELTVHINDREHLGHFADTDPGTVTVTSAWQTFRISLDEVAAATGRGEDLSDIRHAVFLARGRLRGAFLEVDDIRLE